MVEPLAAVLKGQASATGDMATLASPGQEAQVPVRPGPRGDRRGPGDASQGPHPLRHQARSPGLDHRAAGPSPDADGRADCLAANVSPDEQEQPTHDTQVLPALDQLHAPLLRVGYLPERVAS